MSLITSHRMCGYQMAITVAALFLAGGCQQAPDYATKAIDSPGTFECFSRKMIVTVSHAPNDLFNYQIARKDSKVGPTEPPLHGQWCIFPETPDRAWVYDGGRDVTRVEFTGDAGSKFTSSQVVPEILKEAPAPFRDRLPQALKGG